ncbi:oligosaccharide flippase family protein [Bacillus sp. JJ1532]|uniref:oligosaccharide flippase family protein n=1 Tax=Bacillus sp. JJ1532 TaxID=3122958 RepID=UPI002FFE3F51
MKPSIATDAVKLTTSKIIILTISFLNAMLLSRFLTLEEYGTYSQIFLVINLLVTVFMLGLPNSINFFLAKAERDEEKQKFLSVYYSLSTILSLITGLALVLITPIIVNYFDNEHIKKFIYVLAFYPWSRIIQSSIENILVIYQKTTYLMTFTTLHGIFQLSIIVIVIVFNESFSMYMLLFVIMEAIFTFSVYLIVKNLVGNVAINFDKQLIKRIFKFSLPIGLASVIGTVNIEFGKLLIGRFFNTEELAIYTNATKEMPVTIIATSLTAVLMPQLVRLLNMSKNEKAITLWGDATILSYLFICFFAAGLFTFAPEVISLLYSDKYLPGVTVFRICTIVLLLRCTYFGMILNCIGKTSFIFYSSLLSLVLNGILSIVCFFIFGFIGPAVSTVLSIAMIQILQLVATSKSIKISFKKVFPWRTVGIITILNFFLAIAFSLIKEYVSLENSLGEIFESIILGLLWGTFYFTIMAKYIKQKWIVLNEVKVSS